jgi:hypothetical protein
MKALGRMSSLVIAGTMTLGAAALVVAPPSGAAARANSVDLTVKCSKGSLANLQVQREDNGQLSIDAGVDMARHVAGVPWRLRVTDNSTTIVSGVVKTAGDGSFSVSRLITPRSGANHVVVHATNLRTGETCVVSGTV